MDRQVVQIENRSFYATRVGGTTHYTPLPDPQQAALLLDSMGLSHEDVPAPAPGPGPERFEDLTPEEQEALEDALEDWVGVTWGELPAIPYMSPFRRRFP